MRGSLPGSISMRHHPRVQEPSPPWISALLALVALGCAVEPVDLSEKRCPCAEPFVCDMARDRCVSARLDCDARAEGFRAVWSTANVIRWEWAPRGERSSFVRYELEVAERPEDLGTSAARIIGPDENPELGGYVLPRTGGADDVVTSTMSYDHDSETTYVARLLVTDTTFCTFRSEMAAISTTLDPPEELVLYGGPRPDPGFPVPGDLEIVDDGAGGMATQHVPSRDPECLDSGEGVCSQNIRWSGLDVSAADISEGEHGNVAMLEVELTNDTDTASFFSRVWIQIGGFHRLEPFTIPSARRVYQVPLRVLVGDDGATTLTHATLQAAAVEEVNVGGQWSRCAPGESPECFGGRVLLHRASIRY